MCLQNFQKMAIYSWDVTYTILLVLGFALHVLGSYIMVRCKAQPTNQRIMILNLAAAEILFCSIQIVLIIVPCDYQFKKPVSTINIFASDVCLNVFKLLIFFLVFDRLAAIRLHMKYETTVTRKVIHSVTACSWLVGLMIAVVHVFLRELSYNAYKLATIWACLSITGNILIFINTCSTFIYLYIKVRRIKKYDKNMTSVVKKYRERCSCHKFLLPVVMAVTYFLFDVTRDAIDLGHIIYRNKSLLLKILSEFTFVIGICSDALVYIFFQKQVRRRIRETFSKLIHSTPCHDKERDVQREVAVLEIIRN